MGFCGIMTLQNPILLPFSPPSLLVGEGQGMGFMICPQTEMHLILFSLFLSDRCPENKRNLPQHACYALSQMWFQ